MKSDTYHDIDLPNDEELERLTRYVGGYMTAEEVELFDRQLETDQQFFYRMAPMLDAWYSPEPLPIEIETLEELDRRAAIVPIEAAPSRPLTTHRWRKPAAVIAGFTAAAEVLFFILQAGTRATPELSRMVADVPAAHESLAGKQTAPLSASNHTTPRAALHPRQVAAVTPPVRVVIPSETIADQALLDSTMRTLGPMPDVAVTLQTRVSAAVDSLFFTASEWVADQLNLGNDHNLITPPTRPGSATIRGTPDTPGKGWQLPLWLRPWDWQWLRGG